ncbi:MAG: hypothetical protein ACE14L_03670 [Terriglobales bacterium]
MPTAREHRARAEHNLAFARTFDLPKTLYIDWAVTAYFYAGLHWVDALLAHYDSFHPPKHEIRNECVRTKWYLRAIKHEYFELKDRSEAARYELATFTSAKVENQVIPLYDAIEQHAIQQLQRPGAS